MSRLPNPGSDAGTWGSILNDFLAQSHKADGSLQDNAVTSTSIANGSITSPKLASGAVSAVNLAPNAVSVTTIQDGAITGYKLASGAVANDKLQDNAVTTAKILNDTVTEAKLDPAIRTKLNAPAQTTVIDSSITAKKLDTPTYPAPNNGDALVLDNSTPGGFKWQALTTGSALPSGPAGGDLTGTYPNPTLKDAAISVTKLQDGVVTTAKLSDSSVTAPKIQDKSITVNKLSSTVAPTTDQILSFNGSALVWVDKPTTSGATGDNTGDQTLSLTNATLTISGANGNAVTLPSQSQADWSQGDVSKPDYIKNKPTIPAAVSPDSDVSLGGSGASDTKIASQKATKSYIDTAITTTTGFIKNQYNSVQPANMWLDGKARVEGQTVLGGASNQVQLALKAHADHTMATPLLGFQNSDGTSRGWLNTDSNGNIGLGINAAAAVTTASGVIAIGPHAFEHSTTARGIAIGPYSLQSNTTGLANVAVGNSALQTNTTGSENTALGESALIANTTGAYNTAIGSLSLSSNSTGEGNVGVGQRSLRDNVAGKYNTALGASTLFRSTVDELTAVGAWALAANTTGKNNTAIGTYTLSINDIGHHNTAVGMSALSKNVGSATDTNAGSRNTAVGASSLANNATGASNTAVGGGSLEGNTTGDSNVAIGVDAMCVNSTGRRNVSIGTESLRSSTTSEHSVAIGYQSQYFNTTGGWNASVGAEAMFSNTTGDGNAAVGYAALHENTTGQHNTALGNDALFNNTTGQRNSAIGFAAGRTDVYNQFSTLPDIDNATAIGTFAQVQQSNSIVLGSVDFEPYVGIGTTKPQSRFSVSPVGYSTGTAEVVGAGTVVTGTGTNWESWLTGFHFIFANGQSSLIASVDSPTKITLRDSLPIIANQAYRIHQPTLAVTDTNRVGINTFSPGAMLDVNGDIRAKHITTQSVSQVGMGTTSSTDAHVGQWTKIATVEMFGQYEDARSIAMIASIDDGGFMNRLCVDIKVKQQAPMGQAPVVHVLLSDVLFMEAGDISAVIIENSAAKTRVELWLKIRNSWQAFTIAQLMNSNEGKVMWLGTQSFQATLPAGNVINAVFAPGAEEWTPSIPSTATSPGFKGQKALDANFLYVCTADNMWRRIPLNSW